MANRIALELIADANPMMKALDQAQRSLDQFTKSAQSAGQEIGGSLSTAIDNFTNFAKGGAAAAGILAGGFAAAAAGAVALTASAADQVDELDRLSQKTGIALSTLQSWSVIMDENGIQAEALTSGMRTLSKQIVEARDPSSKAAAAFKEIGISINGLSTTDSVIRDLSDRFKEMPDGPEKAALAIQFLGKAGLDMIPLMNKGSKAFDESKEAAKRYGAQLNDLQNNALKATDTELGHVGVAANALKLNLASIFAPSVEWAARMLADAIGFLAHQARAVDTALDTLAIRLTHIGLAAKQLGSVLFSKDVLNTSAWQEALKNITLIDQEAAKLIAKRRALADVATVEKGTTVQMGATVARGAMVRQGPDQSDHVAAYQAEQVELRALGNLQNFLGRMTVEHSQKQQQNLSKELDLYFQTEKKISVLTSQEEAGAKIVQQATEVWKHRNDTLEMAVERAKVLDEAEQTRARTELSLFGQSKDAINARMNLIEAEGALRKRLIEESIFDERRRKAALENLDIELDTKKRQVAQAYPTFFQQQMKALEQSNAFSISLISNTWTSGLANAIVNGGNFAEQAWKSTQVALLQGVLNFVIGRAAILAAAAANELAIEATLVASKISLNTAKNATIVAGDAAAATATTSIWAGAAAGITGTFAVLTGAITGFFTETLIPFFVSIGEALMTFLSSIAGAASSTIFGIPYGVAILAGVALIGAAIGSLAAFAFADGGIVTGPTMGMVGEAGSSEAVIPLNKRGASFMNEALGGGKGGGPTTIIVELDKRIISRAVFDELPSIMRLRGVPA
jgi:hypothetical protein